MPTPQSASHSRARSSSRPVSKARNELLAQLKEDHQRVKKAYAKYRRLDAEEDAEARQALVRLVLDELSVHARLEEELLYPAAKEQLEDGSQIEEAEVEHEMLHILIDQLRELDAGHEADEAQRHARFTVLCEYTLHHVKEEEREMFPQLMKARLDWVGLTGEMQRRRSALKGEDFGEDEDEGEDAGPTEDPDDRGPDGRADAAAARAAPPDGVNGAAERKAPEKAAGRAPRRGARSRR